MAPLYAVGGAGHTMELRSDDTGGDATDQSLRTRSSTMAAIVLITVAGTLLVCIVSYFAIQYYRNPMNLSGFPIFGSLIRRRAARQAETRTDGRNESTQELNPSCRFSGVEEYHELRDIRIRATRPMAQHPRIQFPSRAYHRFADDVDTLPTYSPAPSYASSIPGSPRSVTHSSSMMSMVVEIDESSTVGRRYHHDRTRTTVTILPSQRLSHHMDEIGLVTSLPTEHGVQELGTRAQHERKGSQI
ncbi:hypothetical protein BU16DRAFT_554440 [Lophium mytilinum]|uniref:Uncharacterized protein n=1 Tax=Lophium mytilinum TaxID=390894 RepID=A0A6A6RBZ9_9PEZI|nr:hypothetical protein BU16DRAFT_554440 [Lophium mytilinum]